MSSSSSDSDMEDTPPEVREEAKLAMDNLFPEKSKEKYMRAYEIFMQWRKEKTVSTFSEPIFLAYFNELAKSKLPSTLWAIYSMLKFTVNVKHNINIKNYLNLTSFLKRQSSGFKGKKSRAFTSENITRFLHEASDDRFLVTKVALIFGVNGACRTIELYNLTNDDVTQHDDVILVKLRDTKTKIDRLFVVPDEYRSIVEKYRALRPPRATSDKFFIQYRNGKCINQVIGRHKISSFPKEVAVFLDLPNSESFTGHCFRRTSATLLADSGANLTTLKRHGGWKSDKVAEGYIEESVKNKTKISQQLNKDIQYKNNTNKSSASHTITNNEHEQSSTSTPLTPRPSTSGMNLTPAPTAPPTSQFATNANLPTASITNTQTDIQQTNISVPGSSVNLTFTNCTMSNITFNLK